MSFTEDLINDLAAYLDIHVGVLKWRATGTYSAEEFGIYAMTAPLAKTRQALVIRVYDTEDDLTLSDSTVAVQFDWYGTPLSIVRAMDDTFDCLQGLWGGKLGSVKVQSIDRDSGAPLGQDEAGNLRVTENYSLAVHRPSPNRQ